MLPSYLADTDLSSIKLVATDMDLTLLADDKSMPEGVDERIEALMRNGVIFCAASGRPALALREEFAAHHQDMLADDKSMPEGVDERIEALMRNGVIFCAASGRPALALREEFAAHHQDMALEADNGASVYLRDEPVYRDLIERDLWHGVLSLATVTAGGIPVLCAFDKAYDNGASVYLRDEPVYRDLIERDLWHGVLSLATVTAGGIPVLCAFDKAYVLERDRRHQDVVGIYYRSITYVESFDSLDVDSNKISIYFPGWDSKRQLDEVYGPAFGDRLYLTCAGDEWLDFMNIGIDKGAGIRHLVDHLGIALADVAAFGDTYNDIPMLDIVGHSYVMGNAAEHMHAHGKFLAPTNNEAGVLTVIDRITASSSRRPTTRRAYSPSSTASSKLRNNNAAASNGTAPDVRVEGGFHI